MRGVLALALLLAVVAAAPATGAVHVKPTATDRANAGAFIAAAKQAYKTGRAAVAALPNITKVTDSTCDGAVAASFPGSGNADTGVFEALSIDAYGLLILHTLGPTVATYDRALQEVHTRDPVLRRYASYVAATMLPHVERYGGVPSFDICKLFRDWQAAGFKAGFDWVSDAHVDPSLAADVELDFGKLGTPPTLYNPIGNRLVDFGVRSSVAFWFPNALLHAAGQ